MTGRQGLSWAMGLHLVRRLLEQPKAISTTLSTTAVCSGKSWHVHVCGCHPTDVSRRVLVLHRSKQCCPSRISCVFASICVGVRKNGLNSTRNSAVVPHR